MVGYEVPYTRLLYLFLSLAIRTLSQTKSRPIFSVFPLQLSKRQSVADGIEAARKMCGGHGYSQFSGLPDLSSGYLALATLEGTQQVLEPQTAR